MRTLFHAMMLVLTESKQRELARQVQFLKVENQLLRSKLPKRVSLECLNHFIVLGERHLNGGRAADSRSGSTTRPGPRPV
jgi:hypothetical protein